MRILGSLLALSIGMMLALACDESDPNFNEGITPENGALGGPGTVIAVEEAEYSIQVNRNKAVPGEVTFHARNTGSFAHQFLVLKTEVVEDNLPLKAVLGQVDVESDKVEVIAKQEAFPPGEDRNVIATLEPGHYVLICNLPGHYSRGMHIDFIVSDVNAERGR